MPDYIPQLSLKTFQVPNSTFTPVAYTPIEYDGSLLSRSLQQQEARETAARNDLNNITQHLVQTRAALNDVELPWFDEYSKQIQDRIKAEVDAGNYQSAVKFAQQEAYNMANNKDLQNKIAVNALYQKELNAIDTNSKYDAATKRYWKAMNQYSYDGSRTWKEKIPIVEDISLVDLQRMAVSMTAEDAKSLSDQHSGRTEELIDKNGNITDDITKAVGRRSVTASGEGWSKSSHKKTKEDIEKTFRSLLADSAINKRLSQKFDVSLWDYNDTLARSEDMSLSETERNQAYLDHLRLKKEMVNKDGTLITDYDTWLNKKVIPMFENTEYYNTAESTSNSGGTTYDDNMFKRNLNKDIAQSMLVTEEEVGVKGTVAKTIYQVPTLEWDANSNKESADDYANLFN